MKYIVEASFCEHYDVLHVEASSPEEAKRAFCTRLEKEGLQGWPDHEIRVEDVTSRADRLLHLAFDRTVPLWREDHFSHQGSYHYIF